MTESIRDILEEGETVAQIATGFSFTEGPIWNAEEGYLLFSDMPADVRRRWDERAGVQEVMQPSNKCNGMTWDGEGNLVVCEHATSSVVREYREGSRQTIAYSYEGKELNSPNDVVVKSDGGIYFTDPTYGRMAGFGVEREPELGFQGVYRIEPSGDLRLLVNDFAQPNGLCFSPDESILYVNDTERTHIRAFHLTGDGAVREQRLFFENIGTGDPDIGVPDGMKCDDHGNVYVTGPGGIWVITSEGRHVGVIESPEVVVNLNWGDADFRTLYMTCTTSLYRVRLRMRGVANYIP